jgi:hypothetical protein
MRNERSPGLRPLEEVFPKLSHQAHPLPVQLDRAWELVLRKEPSRRQPIRQANPDSPEKSNQTIRPVLVHHK